MSLGPIPSGRLKNLKDIDKWSSLSLCLSVRVGMSVTRELGLYLCSQDGSNSAFSPVVLTIKFTIINNCFDLI